MYMYKNVCITKRFSTYTKFCKSIITLTTNRACIVCAHTHTCTHPCTRTHMCAHTHILKDQFKCVNR